MTSRRALEVTKPTVYYYVTSKEQLLFQCFVAGVERIRAAFREVTGLELPARERLNAVLRHYGEAVASEFGWCMVRAEDQDLSPAMSRHIKALKSEIDHGIRRLIREGIQDGSIQPCDPKMTAFALAGALNWIAHWYREDQSMTGAQIAEAFVTIFEGGLRPAQRRRRPRPRAPLHSRRRRARPLKLTYTEGSHHVRHHEVVIVSAKRTPIGAFLGALSPLTAVQLGSAAVKAAVEAAGVAPADIQEVIMGCVLPAGLGPGTGAPGRPRGRDPAGGAGHHDQQDVRLGAQGGDAGRRADPRRLRRHRAGRRPRVDDAMRPTCCPRRAPATAWATGEVLDHMFYDGLQSPFDGKSMGCFARRDRGASTSSRAPQQDAFATESVRRAMRARWRPASSTPRSRRVTVKSRKGETVDRARRDPRHL